MATFAFSDKARTLEQLSVRLKCARVLPLLHFTVGEWEANHVDVLSRIAQEAWAVESLIVRSSAVNEDGGSASFAGRFLSIVDVTGSAELTTAISTVIESYRGFEHPENRVLIQPMLKNVTLSGVAFSLDPNTGSPYIVINYQVGGDTTSVTGGRTGSHQTAYCWKHERPIWPPLVNNVAALLDELERICGAIALDIEFALDHLNELYLFQVRPLVCKVSSGITPTEQTRILSAVAEKIAAASRPHPYLHGARTVYGIMPDWNPAEMIGVRPRPLALSLYRDIITDSIWAYQRHNYGYKNLRSFPLLVDFQGLPYIDVRVCFNSFIPADIPHELADRLADYYLDRLVQSPALHDKVEFEIVFSCYSFDLPERVKILREYGFSESDCAQLNHSLNSLTNRIINRDTGLWRQDLERIEFLKERFAKVVTAELDTVSRIYWLIEDCKRYGTLPFAGLARAGFIAIQILRSLVTSGVLAEEDRSAFMAGLDTISSSMGRDFANLDRGAFLKKYGHLRPGTYDILSPRYDEAPDQYFDWTGRARERHFQEGTSFTLSLAQMREIGRLLEEHQLEHDVVGLFDFLESGIKGREYSKFVFTRSLSEALSLIRQLGTEYGFTPDDMSFVDIKTILGLSSSGREIHAALAESILHGRHSYARTQSIILPPLIARPDEVWSFEMPPTEPNFITQVKVSAPVALVGTGIDLGGKIVMITNADPGYDWIFSRGIKGFITAYGGVNSHMAIRASELNLPAVIGAGEVLFGQWSSAQMLELDGANRQVRVLR